MVQIEEDKEKQYYRIINLINEEFYVSFGEHQTTIYKRSPNNGVILFLKSLFTSPDGTLEVSFDRDAVSIWGDRNLFKNIAERLESYGVTVTIYD